MKEGEKYRVVLADIAWMFSNCQNGAAEKHYETMPIEDVLALPVSEIVTDDAVLFLWSVWSLQPEAIEVVRAWGFRYMTGFPWIKLSDEPFIDLWGNPVLRLAYGTGYWIRGCSEPVLLGKRGTVDPQTSAFCGLVSERFEHSRKPDGLYELAECYEGPRIELFARRRREGWDAWGNEVPGGSDIELAPAQTEEGAA